MILADKIIQLRKKNGWSQEELAEKLQVSRQAVSKWESAQSTPDLNRLLQMSALFGVTTDYLLKDEMETEEYSTSEPAETLRHVSLAEAQTYLQLRKDASVSIALATLLCILSPVPLFLLGASSESPAFPIPEDFAGLMGIILLLILVAAAVTLYVLCGLRNQPFEFLEKEPFETEYGVAGLVQERRAAYRPTYIRYHVLGTVLCVLAPIPLLAGGLFDSPLAPVLLCATLAVAGAGVTLYILAGVNWAAMQRLLQEEDFTIEKKQQSRLKERVSVIYWALATAVFLALTLPTRSWESSWVVWPIAGVLYAGVMAVCSLIDKGSDN